MNVEVLKSRVAELASGLKGNGGKIVMSSDGGPIGIGVINDIVETLAGIELRIAEIERRVNENRPS
jgi:ribosome biogenesis protein Nip4